MILWSVPTWAQTKVRHVYSEKEANGIEYYAARQLRDFLYKGGLRVDSLSSEKGTIFVGRSSLSERRLKHYDTILENDGYAIYGDGNNLYLYGAGEKGTLYAVYAYLETIGYRLYTPTRLITPCVSELAIPVCDITSNPAFEYREVSYYYPNHSQLYADWHHLNTQADRHRQWGMFVHTFNNLIPPELYYDSHPEWFSLNNGHRSRDGQLCLSNPEVLTMLCQRLADTMASCPDANIWSVSPNDNYNACQCRSCQKLDSVMGGPSGTLIYIVNQIARQYPNKTIATLAYQYTRSASSVVPDSNVLVMLCPIEAGRECPIATSPNEKSFRTDINEWSHLTNNLFLWDYVVQFRNFWNPFPNLHVLQPNLQFFYENGVRMMFEQASGADNITSWMDIRCYMIAKLLWDPYVDIDSVMSDFYRGYYGEAGVYVRELIDTMTQALVASNQRLDIYGYPIDGKDGYLSVDRMQQYDSLMILAKRTLKKQEAKVSDVSKDIDSALMFFDLSLAFAKIELALAYDLCGYFGFDEIPPNDSAIIEQMERFIVPAKAFNIPQIMEMGISLDDYEGYTVENITKRFGKNLARNKKYRLLHPATAPYNQCSLTDGKCGVLDYRHNWLGFWGDTMDMVVDLELPTEISRIELNFYFFPLSWIFLPQHVKFLVSSDGNKWNKSGEVYPDNPQILATPHICPLGVDIFEKKQYRYIRIIAEPLPCIPAWHRASGLKSWIFTDELIVK